MNRFESSKEFKCEITNVGLGDADELGEEMDRVSPSVWFDKLAVFEGEFHGFEQDRVVAVVLVDVLGHCHVSVHVRDAVIDFLKELSVLDWRREMLQNLKDLYLKPRAWRHVVVVVLCVVLDVPEDEHQLRNQALVPLRTHDLDRAFKQRHSGQQEPVVGALEQYLKPFNPLLLAVELLVPAEE